MKISARGVTDDRPLSAATGIRSGFDAAGLSSHRCDILSPGTARPDLENELEPGGRTQSAKLSLQCSHPGPASSCRPKTNVKDASAQQQVDKQPDTVQTAGDDPEKPTSIGPPQMIQVPESPLLSAIRAYVGGRPDQAIEFLSSLDKANQEFVLGVLPALVRGATLDMNADPGATAILAEQLQSAAARIETRAALRIEVATLCETVVEFANYQPWPKGKSYKPNDKAWLYLEVRNLVSQPTGPRGETFLTHGRATVEIRDAHEKLVDQPSIEDPRRLTPVVQYDKKWFTRTPVHDLYILYGFPVPRTPGVYTISYKIQDPTTRRVVKTDPIEFTVAGP